MCFNYMKKTVEHALQVGIKANHAGNQLGAAEIFSGILKAQPNHPEANHNLGKLAIKVGKLQEAIAHFKLAVKQGPYQIQFWRDYINALVAIKEFKTAKRELEAGIELGLSLDLVVQLQIMMNELSAHECETNKTGAKKNVPKGVARIIASNRQFRAPTTSEINTFLSVYNTGNFQLAEQIAIALTKKYPKNEFGWNCLGVIQKKTGQSASAEKSYRKAIEIKENFADAYSNLGNLLRMQNRLDEALACCYEAIRHNPKLSEGYNNLGNILQDLGRLTDAEAAFLEAIRLNPALPEAHFNLGYIYKCAGNLIDSTSSYEKAINLKPDYAEAHCNLANILREQKQFDDSLVYFNIAAKINPDIDWVHGDKIHTYMNLSNWTNLGIDIEELESKITNNKKACTPFVALGVVDEPSLHKLIAEIYVNAKCQIKSIGLDSTNISKSKKIKIGYYSADFHAHATMHLMAEMLEKHNKEKFEIYAFSFGPQTNDEWQARCKDAFDHYFECNKKTDIEVAQLSKQLAIDIAVDLKGYTTDSRPQIFAHRAAPVQVNFLGYPGTTGARYMDYLIGDKIVTPEINHKFYSEKLVLLPNCYQPNCRNRDISDEQVYRTEFGLPENGLVFSSFNDNYKITPDIFKSWMRILRYANESVLWLLATNESASNNLRAEAVKFGVNPNRLIFAEKLPIERHLNRMQLADVMLDTFPYGAHTTCSDALRVGLPVITLQGKSFGSRVASSLLTAISVPELITTSFAQYETLAIYLAKNPSKLMEIKSRIISNVPASPLFDSSSYTKNIESAYEAMLQRHLNGLPPDNIHIYQ